jgi:hypothetical protein
MFSLNSVLVEIFLRYYYTKYSYNELLISEGSEKNFLLQYSLKSLSGKSIIVLKASAFIFNKVDEGFRYKIG